MTVVVAPRLRASVPTADRRLVRTVGVGVGANVVVGGVTAVHRATEARNGTAGVIRLTAWNRAIQPLHPWDVRCRPRGWPLLPAQRDLLTHLTTDGRCALAGGLSPVHLIRPIRRR